MTATGRAPGKFVSTLHVHAGLVKMSKEKFIIKYYLIKLTTSKLNVGEQSSAAHTNKH